MAQVFKIKYEDTLRRVCVKTEVVDGYSYSELEIKVRTLFQIPYTSRVTITYLDTEGDIVTMADDQDLRDACLIQQLNPLKLEVKVFSGETKNATIYDTEFNVEGLLKGLFPQSTARAIEQVLNRYPPCLFTTVPAHVLPEALDTFLKTLMGHRDVEPVVAPKRGSHGKVGAVHKGIVCDHCGMTPIVGPRYKSLKMHDYDLCVDCFNALGNAMDYKRLDCPMGRRNHCHVPSVTDKAAEDQSFPSLLSRPMFSRGPFGWIDAQPSKLQQVKADKGMKEMLDAQFLVDVTIPDGTKVEAGTSFTKIWRLKNSGMLPWPQLTQLVRTNGDLFGSNGSVKLELPEGGLPCFGEIDVHVEFKAPELPSRYVSYWHLMAPSGQRFGHKVWVLVEVVQNCSKKQGHEAKESHTVEILEDSDNSLLKSTHGTVEAVTDLGPSSNRDVEPIDSDSGLRLEAPLVDVMDSQLANFDEQHCEPEEGFSLVQCASVKESRLDDENPANNEEFELVDCLSYQIGALESNKCDVNTEQVQESNNGLEDDFAMFTGWDHMLKELEEMGFHDTPTNRQLLVKNEGSIKRAVKELVEMEKQLFGKKIKAA